MNGRSNPCLCCPPIVAKLSLDRQLVVGFGDAHVEVNGRHVLDAERFMWATGVPIDVAFVESLVSLAPDNDWRIVLHGPLHGETYQRQAEGWVLVERNGGFA